MNFDVYGTYFLFLYIYTIYLLCMYVGGFKVGKTKRYMNEIKKPSFFLSPRPTRRTKKKKIIIINKIRAEYCFYFFNFFITFLSTIA